MEQIILFQVPEADAVRIKRFAGTLHIRTRMAEPEEYRQTLGCLAGITTHKSSERYEGTPPKESLLLFCNVSEKHLDELLARIRKENILLDYKAVLTPSNQNWNVLRMYGEMEKEKRLYTKATPAD